MPADADHCDGDAAVFQCLDEVVDRPLGEPAVGDDEDDLRGLRSLIENDRRVKERLKDRRRTEPRKEVDVLERTAHRRVEVRRAGDAATVRAREDRQGCLHAGHRTERLKEADAGGLGKRDRLAFHGTRSVENDLDDRFATRTSELAAEDRRFTRGGERKRISVELLSTFVEPVGVRLRVDERALKEPSERCAVGERPVEESAVHRRLLRLQRRILAVIGEVALGRSEVRIAVAGFTVADELAEAFLLGLAIGPLPLV